MPLEGGYVITARELPPARPSPYHLRLATAEDVPALMVLADEAGADLAIHSVRGADTLAYLWQHSRGTEMESEVWVVEDATGQPPAICGYVRLPNNHFGEELTVNETSRLNFAQADAVLRHMVGLAAERHTPGVRLCLPATCTLMRVAKSYGARDNGTYAWQIFFPDIAQFLRTIAPALDKRIADSPFAGMTYDLGLSFFRHTVQLRFVDGHLTQVDDATTNGGAANRFPPRAFTSLVLGYRSLDEVRATFPDCGVASADRLLIETLFPKVQAFLYTIY